jgi:hypothetical protein
LGLSPEGLKVRILAAAQASFLPVAEREGLLAELRKELQGTV